MEKQETKKIISFQDRSLEIKKKKSGSKKESIISFDDENITFDTVA
jgi:hypothetical protein